MVLVSATALVKKYLIDLNKVFKKVDIKYTDLLSVAAFMSCQDVQVAQC